MNEQEVDSPRKAREDGVKQVGHRLRSDIHGLLGYLEIFSEVRPKLEPRERELLDRINAYAQEIADLLIDLLIKIEARS